LEDSLDQAIETEEEERTRSLEASHVDDFGAEPDLDPDLDLDPDVDLSPICDAFAPVHAEGPQYRSAEEQWGGGKGGGKGAGGKGAGGKGAGGKGGKELQTVRIHVGGGKCGKELQTEICDAGPEMKARRRGLKAANLAVSEEEVEEDDIEEKDVVEEGVTEESSVASLNQSDDVFFSAVASPTVLEREDPNLNLNLDPNLNPNLNPNHNCNPNPHWRSPV